MLSHQGICLFPTLRGELASQGGDPLTDPEDTGSPGVRASMYPSWIWELASPEVIAGFNLSPLRASQGGDRALARNSPGP